MKARAFFQPDFYLRSNIEIYEDLDLLLNVTICSYAEFVS